MRVAIITGGMGGLRQLISTKMHAAGYRVLVTHSPGNANAKEWLSGQKAAGREFGAYPVDVADFDSRRNAWRGLPKMSAPSTSWSTTRASRGTRHSRRWTRQLGRGHSDQPGLVFNMTKQVCDGMVDRGWGRVINISSVNGRRARSDRPTIRPPKPACTDSPRRWRSKLRARGSPSTPFRPATSAPRWSWRFPRKCSMAKIIPQIPMGRLGKPEEIAGLVAYLCSDEAAFITGANIAINGGQHMQ